METERILEEITERTGWSFAIQHALMVRYIENQKSPEAFRDFLLDIASQEQD